jgi:DNA repair photolyase
MNRQSTNRHSTIREVLPRPIPPTPQGPVGNAGPTGGLVRRKQSARGAPATSRKVPTVADVANATRSTAGSARDPDAVDDARINAGADSSLDTSIDAARRRGRGAVSNASGRYEPMARVAFDDGWQNLEDLPAFETTVAIDATRRIITRNESPDISFDRSINPYRGCEHGCIYCFARPTHAYLGLSPGLDFESKLFAKPEAPRLLARELSEPGYEPRTIAIGTNTDPYQPIEKQHQIMRRILEVLDEFNHPVGIVTKSALVLRDLDILSRMAKRNLVKVALSVTTLDPKLARLMEPRAATPMRRLDALRQLSAEGVPTAVMVRDMRGGKDYDATFGKRMTGTGPIAWLIGRRFETACERFGLNKSRSQLATHLFSPPRHGTQQLSLF